MVPQITSGLEVGKMIQGEEVGREDVLGGLLHCGTAFGGRRRLFRWRRGGGGGGILTDIVTALYLLILFLMVSGR